MSVDMRWTVTQRIGIWVRDTGIAETDFFSAAESRVDDRTERVDKVVAGEINYRRLGDGR